jgi:hypothetical protein
MMNNVLARAEQQIINTARPVALAIITSSSAGLDSARRIIAVVYPPTIPSSNIPSPQQQHPPSPTAAAAVIVAAVCVCNWRGRRDCCRCWGLVDSYVCVGSEPTGGRGADGRIDNNRFRRTNCLDHTDGEVEEQQIPRIPIEWDFSHLDRIIETLLTPTKA